MSNYARTKRSKRGIEVDEDEGEEEDERMPYFVPEEGIDIEPLALYTRSILDEGVKVKLGNHPQRTHEKGFWIISAVAVSREDIIAMIEDTRSWNREKKKGHYANSATAKRRLQTGRAPQGRERAAQSRGQQEAEDSRNTRQGARASVEPDPRYMPPPPVSRASADNVVLADRQRQLPTASPSPRPASTQPTQNDPRRLANPSQQYATNVPGYIQATAQYTVQANIPQAQYASYSNETSMYEAAPPPYQSDTKRGAGAGGGGGQQPSTTGTQGFSSLYATSGGPPAPNRAPNQGQRRHDSR